MFKRREDIDRTLPMPPAVEPVEQLSRAVQLLLQQEAQLGSTSEERIERISIPVDDEIDPVQWLSAQNHATKIFWESRDDAFYSAGLGIADQVFEAHSGSLQHLRAKVDKKLGKSAKGARYYGGMRFNADQSTDANWPAFGSYCFVLPRFELQRVNGQNMLSCNLVLPRDVGILDRILSEIKSLSLSGRFLLGNCPLPISRKDTPRESDWHDVIHKALDKIRNGHPLEKVVLARKVEFAFADPYDKFLLFKLLREATPNCFHFFIQLQNDRAFLGAPPERLYRRENRSIVSEAVAGTGKRDHAGERDTELGNALLLSDKDQREHAFVRRNIERVFNKICTHIQKDEKPSLMNLNIGRHLFSRFQGLLKKSVSDVDILQQLSPTSAVGGHPKREAFETINQLESFDRGWYAGPLGWISKDAAEFAVAIRSGLALQDKLVLYSGAGIVDGSSAEAEWNEIEQKIGDFVKALGLDHKSAKY